MKHAGKISHEAAIQKAESEYLKYQENLSGQIAQVERDFLIEAKKISKIKQIPTGKKTNKKASRKIDDKTKDE